jgi:hypothetical protein
MVASIFARSGKAVQVPINEETTEVKYWEELVREAD